MEVSSQFDSIHRKESEYSMQYMGTQVNEQL